MKKKYFVSIIIVCPFFIFFSYLNGTDEVKKEVVPSISKDKLYGLEINNHKTLETRIKKNETLSELMERVSCNKDTYEFLLGYKKLDTFNVNKIIVGKKFQSIYLKNDTVNKPKYYIYHKNKVEKVIITNYPKPKISTYKVKVDTLTKVFYSNINGSLIYTFLKNKIPIDIAYRVFGIYAWTIDFYHLNNTDEISVVYEIYKIKNEELEPGRILAASFTHRNKKINAIGVFEKNRLKYYDENGKSLVGRFLKSPLNYSRISSRYSKKRYHPVLKRYKAHLGTDYAAPTGTPIKTIGDGVIKEIRRTKNNGKFIKVYHDKKYTSQYLHMSRFNKKIKKGTRVKQGDVIGYVGSTGLATGPHLCFRFWVNGKQVDFLRYSFLTNKNKIIPKKYLPIHKKNLDRYKKHLKIQNNNVLTSK